MLVRSLVIAFALGLSVILGMVGFDFARELIAGSVHQHLSNVEDATK